MLLTAMPGAVQALSIASLPPHKPENACPIVWSLVNRIVAGKTSDESTRKRPIDDSLLLLMTDGRWIFDGIKIVTDELGKVDRDKMPALTKSMTTHDGESDKRPAKVVELRRIVDDKTNPMYIAVISRERWEKTRYTEMDAMGYSEGLPPGYETRRSFWIVEFRSNSIETFREAGEMYKLAYRNDAPNVCR